MNRTTCPAPARLVQRSVTMSLAVFASFVLLANATGAQDHETAPEAPANVRSGNADSVQADVPPDPPHRTVAPIDVQKRKKAFAALMAVAGIAICGVGAIAATMLWARHVRRLARDPGAPQRTAGNDFWFLKPPKLTVAKTDIDESRQSPDPPSAEMPE